MNQLHHERIDKGMPRKGNHRSVRRADGSFLPAYSKEQRTAVVEDAEMALQRGETTDEIGQRHGIPGRSVRAILIGDPRAAVSRQLMIASELTDKLEDMSAADGPLPLARAREEFRAWSWLAERRLPEYYGPKQEVRHTGNPGPIISIQLSAAPQLVQDSTNHNVLENASTPGETP